MGNSNRRILQTQLTIVGFILGSGIVVCYLILELIFNKLPLNIHSINQIIEGNSSFWFIFTSPFLLALLAYLFNRLYSKQISQLQKNLLKEKKQSNNILNFVNNLNSDKTDAKFSTFSADDKLGEAVQQLREKIKKGEEEEEKRRIEDKQRNWIAEGLAKFGEILRHNNDNLEELSYNLISNLVKYIDANQGGFFLINDEANVDPYIEQTAAYAYNRKKFVDKKLEWGEGMIGTCILEKNTLHLKKVPDDYLYVTSGLGQAIPKNLLIVPLLVNEEVYGAMELASFNEFHQHMINFVEEVGESIATTISNVKTNLKTSKLLSETREQSEAMKSQDEEIRQNLEELVATQEEAKRQSEEFISFANSVNHTMIRSEYSTDGILLYANTKFLNKLGYSKNSEVEGQHISMFINIKDRDWFNDIWKGLAEGGKHFEGYMKHVTKEGQDLWTMATYTCVRNDDRSVKKILFLALDTTELKKQSLDFKGQLDALNRSNIKAEFFTSGSVLDCNRKFRETFKYALVDIYDKQLFDFMHRDEKKLFEEQWAKIIKGRPVEGVFKMLNSDKEEKWLRGSFSPVYDMYNEIAKIIFVANDITREKIMEIENEAQNKKLKTHEEKLKVSEVNLSRRLKETREEVRQQFKEIEKVKITNEKILEGALDAIFTINQNGTISFFNKAAEELWGLTKNAVLGKNVHILFSKENIEKEEFIRKLVKPGTNKIVGVRKEITIMNSKEQEIPVLILLSAADVENEHSYTAFVQNISVDLF